MKITWKNCFKVGVSAFLLYLCIYYWGTIAGIVGTAISAFTSLLVGLCIAYVLNLLMGFYERHYFVKLTGKRIIEKTRRPVCIAASILSLLSVIAFVVYLVVPELISCITFLISEIPPLIESILSSNWVQNNIPEDIMKTLASIDWGTYVSTLFNAVTAGIGDVVNIVIATLSSVISIVVTIFLSIVFAVYILLSKDKLIKQSKLIMRRYMPRKTRKRTLYVLSVLNLSFRRYIIGQCTEAIILGALCTIGMLIFRFPYAGMIGALIGFTALIPIAGAYIGAIVGSIMILTVSPIKALLFLVFILVLQQLEGNLIYPKVVGDSIGLPAIWVLAAVTVGGALFGIPGMLIGVPFTATLYRLLREDVYKEQTEKTVKPSETTESPNN